MNRLFVLPALALLGGCVVAEPVRVAAPPPVVALPPPSVVAADPYCREEAREARGAQAVANQERREAQAFGGRRQRVEAAAAQAEANRQRAQAARAC